MRHHLIASGLLLLSLTAPAHATGEPTSVELALPADIINYGRGYEVATASMLYNRVTLQGMIRLERARGARWKSGQVLLTLPEGMRPSGQLVFDLNQHSSSVRVDVKPSGEVVFMTGSGRYPWISLSGITFAVTGKAE